MDLVGSIEGTLTPALATVYGSFGDMGGFGSSVIDGILLAPLFILDTVLAIAGTVGADLGSTYLD